MSALSLAGRWLLGATTMPARIGIASLLLLLLLTHVGVFGWRTIAYDRAVTNDSMNYIDVARNLSAGEGLVQSAVGYIQPRLWEQNFSPHFPDKSRAGHHPGYSVLIAAVGELTGLEHSDAAFAISSIAYGAALTFGFLFASRLLGTAAGLLAVAFLAHQLRWIFLRAWTEPTVIALLLALLALLARGATPRRVLAGGLLTGIALLVRDTFAPMAALGGLACVVDDGPRVRRLMLFAAGASVGLVGPFLGEGQVYSARTSIADSWFPHLALHQIVAMLLYATRWDLVALGFLGACAWWRARRDGGPVVPRRARFGARLAIAWVAGWSVFLILARLFLQTDGFDDRMLAPARAVTTIASALLLWRACPERLRYCVSVAAFATTMALATAGDLIVQGDHHFAQRIYASPARILIGQGMTARVLPPDGDRSDFAQHVATSPRRYWVSRNVTPQDFVAGTYTMDLPYFFRQQVPATVSVVAPPLYPEVSGAKLSAVFLARCERYDNLYLILVKLRRMWGRFVLDLISRTPPEPGTPAADYSLVADLPDSVVYRFSACGTTSLRSSGHSSILAGRTKGTEGD